MLLKFDREKIFEKRKINKHDYLSFNLSKTAITLGLSSNLFIFYIAILASTLSSMYSCKNKFLLEFIKSLKCHQCFCQIMPFALVRERLWIVLLLIVFAYKAHFLFFVNFTYYTKNFANFSKNLRDAMSLQASHNLN